MTTSRASAGVLLWRRQGQGVEVLIAHPGGPLWKNKHEGAWSIPKGVVEGDEDLLDAALREFEEETSHRVEPDGAVALGSVRLKSGKTVHAWAVEGDMDPASLRSNTFEMEWPPRSGRAAHFPEIDAVDWATPDTAAELLNPALVELVRRLLNHLTTSP